MVWRKNSNEDRPEQKVVFEGFSLMRGPAMVFLSDKKRFHLDEHAAIVRYFLFYLLPLLKNSLNSDFTHLVKIHD